MKQVNKLLNEIDDFIDRRRDLQDDYTKLNIRNMEIAIQNQQDRAQMLEEERRAIDEARRTIDTERRAWDTRKRQADRDIGIAKRREDLSAIYLQDLSKEERVSTALTPNAANTIRLRKPSLTTDYRPHINTQFVPQQQQLQQQLQQRWPIQPQMSPPRYQQASPPRRQQSPPRRQQSPHRRQQSPHRRQQSPPRRQQQQSPPRRQQSPSTRKRVADETPSAENTDTKRAKLDTISNRVVVIQNEPEQSKSKKKKNNNQKKNAEKNTRNAEDGELVAIKRTIINESPAPSIIKKMKETPIEEDPDLMALIYGKLEPEAKGHHTGYVEDDDDVETIEIGQYHEEYDHEDSV